MAKIAVVMNESGVEAVLLATHAVVTQGEDDFCKVHLVTPSGEYFPEQDHPLFDPCPRDQGESFARTWALKNGWHLKELN